MQQQTSIARHEAGARLSQREFFNAVFLLMGAGLAITAFVAFLISSNETWMAALFHLYEKTDSAGKVTTTWTASGWWFLAAGAQLILVFSLSGERMVRLNWQAGASIFAVYAALNGLTLAPVIAAYTAASVTQVFLITAITFAGCALWGYTTKRDMTSMGGFFLFALIGLLVAMVMNLIFQSTQMDTLISLVAILLFAALTAYDIQKLRVLHQNTENHNGIVIYGALTFYLDFINLFIHLLRLIGIRK